jgi:hypothetical protein
VASALLTIAELKLALDETGTANDQLYEQLIDQVQAVFEAVCNREERPFTGPEEARTEVHDGTGTTELWLQYPVATLTSLVLGHDTADADETLSVNDKTVLVWGAGSRRLARVDGKRFGLRDVPRYVHVTYARAEDLPKAAKSAVLAGAKLLVNRLGSEGVSAERIGGYSIDYASFVTADMANDPIWKLGVQACWEPRT